MRSLMGLGMKGRRGVVESVRERRAEWQYEMMVESCWKNMLLR